MATFYVQLENKLLQISGDLTNENISKALGYVPVSPNVTNELSQRVDNITFDSLKDNPFLQDGSGELNIVDESGNIIAKIDADGIHSVDFIAGEHRLSDKTDKTYVDEAIKNVEVDLTGYATEEYVNNIDFYNIKDNPIVNNGDGKLLFVDENGYIGLQLEEDGLYVKDVIADGHTLSQKADKSELSNYATKDEVSDLVDMSVVTELQGKVNTLIDTDADKSVRDIAVDVLTETLVSETAAEAYDTLAEMSAWIKSHPEDASAMNTAIQKNATDITNLDAAYKASDAKVLTDAQEYTDNINFYTIKDNPIVDGEAGSITFVDETGYIGLKVTEDGIIAKDVVTPEHTLSNKADKSELPTKTSDLTNDSGFITINDVPVLEIPEEYVTEDEIVNFVEVQDTNDVIDDVETNTYVKYVVQSLSDEQKAQVRENIGADDIYKQKKQTIVLDGDEICDYYAINNLGEAVLADGFGCTSFIPCYGALSLKYTNMQLTASKNYGLSFYDSSKTFISYVPSLVGANMSSVEETVTVPDNAYYFKATYFNYQTQVTVGQFRCEMTFKDDSLYTTDGKRPYQDGFIYFSQKVNQSITKYWETAETPQNDATYKVTTGVIALPKTYKQTGRKTPLILYAHGLSHYVYYGTWGNTDTFRQQKQHWLDMGFAVMDCNGARDNNRKGQFASGVCPQGVNAYKLCVEYILKNYNIDPEIFVVAGSAGGAIGWNYLSMYGQTVKAAVFISAYADLKADAYGGGNQKNLYVEYLGFNNASTYEVDKTIGFDPALKLITINGTKYCFDYYHTPIYGLYGSQDTYTLITSHKNMFAALRNAGATAQLRKIEGVGHEIVSGANIIVDAEVGNWLLSHYSKFDAQGLDITYRNITYVFVDENGNKVQDNIVTKVVDGTSINFANEAPSFTGYNFVSVEPTSSVINSDITVTYTYNKLDAYTVTYVYLNNEGQAIKGSDVVTEYEGTEIDFTTKAPTIQGFNFVSVVPTNGVINSDITVTYTYEPIPTHEVTYVFVNENGEEIADRIIEVVNEGTEIDFTNKAIEINGYRFNTAEPENAIVNEDIIVTLSYLEVSENDLSQLFSWDKQSYMAVKSNTTVQFKTSSYFMSCFTDMSNYIGKTIRFTVPEYTASNGQSSTGRSAWFTRPETNASYFHELIKEWDISTHGNAKGVLVEVETVVPAEAPYLWTSTYMDGVDAYVGPNSGREDFRCYVLNLQKHDVTFECVDTNGEKIADDVVISFEHNEYIEFINHAPIINGYILDNISVENAYIDSDMTIICTYRITNETDITNLFAFDIPSRMVTNTSSNLAPGSSNFQSSSNFMSCFTDLSAYVGKEIKITLPEYKNSAGSISNGVTLWMTEPTQAANAVYSVAKKWDKYDGNNGTGILTEHILTVPTEAPYLWTSTYMDGVSAYVGENSGAEDFHCYVLE